MYLSCSIVSLLQVLQKINPKQDINQNCQDSVKKNNLYVCQATPPTEIWRGGGVHLNTLIITELFEPVTGRQETYCSEIVKKAS